MRLILAFVLFFAGAQTASAATDPCGKYSDADAYNNCLARSGPLAGEHKLSHAAPEPAHSVAPKHVSAPRDGLTHKPNGRVRIEIFR